MPQLVPWPFPAKITPYWRLKSNIIMGLVGAFSRLFLRLASDLHVHNADKIAQFLDSSRAANRPIITVANHASCVDDPILWGLLKMTTLASRNCRWTLAADNICFTKPLHTWFFSLGQGIPVHRGAGVYQPAVDYAIEKLNEGLWVHVFPEGRVNQTPNMLRLKWGVGRMIHAPDVTPIVLPFWHSGLDEVQPVLTYGLRVGKRVDVLFGEPMDFTEQVRRMKSSGDSEERMRKVLTDEIQERLLGLQRQLTQIREHAKQ